MRLDKLNAIMGVICVVLVAILTSSVLATSLCECPSRPLVDRPAAGKQARAQAEQVKKIYIHSNSLVAHIKERNRGKSLEQWSPGDKVMYANGASQVTELLVQHPWLAHDPEARTVLRYDVDPNRQ